MNWYLIASSFAVTLITAFFIIAVLLKGARLGHNRTFCLFALSVGSWSFTHLMWQLAATEAEAIFWLRWLVVSSAFIPYTYLHFVSEVTGKAHRLLLPCGYVIATLVSIAGMYDLVFVGVEARLTFPFWPMQGPIFPVYFGGFAIVVCYCFYLLIQQYLSASAKIKNQNKYLIIGTAIGFLGGGTNFLLWMEIPIPPIGHGLSVFYILGIGYSVIKYRLLDFNEMAIRISGIILASLILGLGFGAFVMVLLNSSGSIDFAPHRLSLFLFFTLHSGLLILVAPAFFKWINRLLQTQFMPEKIQFRKALSELVNKVVIAPDASRPLEEITSRLHDILAADHVCIYARNELGEGYQQLAQYGNRDMPADIPLIKAAPLTKLLAKHRFAIALEDNLVAENWTSKKTLRQLNADGIAIQSNDLIQPILTAETVYGFIIIGSSKNLASCGQLDFLLLDNLASRICLMLKAAELERTTNRMEKLVSIGTMAAGLSHELRNPLVSVRTLAGLLDKSPSALSLNQDFGKIVSRDIQRISAIVESVAAFAQNSRPSLAPVNPDSLLREAESLFSAELEQQNISLTVNCDPQTPLIMGNFDQLLQVLRNLLENAMHAISEWDDRPENGRITINCAAVKTPHSQQLEAVEIRIADNGMGMDNGFMQSIFDPFVTSRDTGLREASAGTGLGLAIVKKIIEQHSGRIAVKSTPAAGTFFTLVLPVAFNPTP
jgi:two-component system nitrogen regulation sensor histidine kinase GlnL